ncbi:RING-H2 finger protein ATL46-like [Pyrus ussuriensis x Pyrus communis]|uniref:RING-type E3 ubiquitin transferase n=1 Tax=Pyrus ussuriensis x Pyrus communis TaxID=2448454 RepID=A0A5N5I0T3_9ROSA|nr:RING-H2 finger protein ATL46-like [Pyrus ussuriensis x Pyrus communis]
MSRKLHGLEQKDGNLIYPPPLLISPPIPSSSSSSSSIGSISPVLLLVIVIVAVMFFIYGFAHLLWRCLTKRSSSSSIFHSNRYPETSGSRAIQRQLQQLFRLHDSGLDQAAIDSLPVFFCKDIVGSKEEPFDCAVCLCEFSDQDKLRLLPVCGHAFHIDCIDTWLLSNSTCPLCRGTLLGSGILLENPVFDSGGSREMSNAVVSDGENMCSSGRKGSVMEESVGEKRVFSVRLGKFKSLNEGGESGGKVGESSRCNLDARRCYSMGAYQYVVGDSNLQIALSHDCDAKLAKEGVGNGSFSVTGNLEGKKISGRHKGESFSVSKIWLWSAKNRFPGSSNAQTGLPPFRVISPINAET